jgi:hypothetical protein
MGSGMLSGSSGSSNRAACGGLGRKGDAVAERGDGGTSAVVGGVVGRGGKGRKGEVIGEGGDGGFPVGVGVGGVCVGEG